MNCCPDPVRPLLALLALFGLSACGQSESAPLARIELAQVLAAPVVLASPDTKGGTWVAADPETARFDDAAGQPLLSLGCDAKAGTPRLWIIRHVPVERDMAAMMALIGNGRIARIKAETEQSAGARYWMASLPADAEELDVFAGTGGVEATVPGAGTLNAGRSDLPRQILTACRARVQPAGSGLPG